MEEYGIVRRQTAQYNIGNGKMYRAKKQVLSILILSTWNNFRGLFRITGKVFDWL